MVPAQPTATNWPFPQAMLLSQFIVPDWGWTQSTPPVEVRMLTLPASE